MSISHLPAREHPAAAALGAARAALGELAEQPVWQLGDGELLRATEELYRSQAVLAAQALRLLAEVDTRALAPDAGSRSTGAWLTASLQTRPGAATGQVSSRTP